MLPTSHDGRASDASSGEARKEHASDDKSRDEAAHADEGILLRRTEVRFRDTGLIQCEVCLRVKPEFQTEPLRQYRTFGRSALQSVAWHTRNPGQPRGSTIWKCVECSLAIDNDHGNWQERISSFGRAKGRIYTSVPEQPPEFYLPRDVDTVQE